MKTILLPVLLAFATLLPAQEAAPPDDRDADKTALRALAKTYETAINSGDLSSLAGSLLPEASAVFLTGDECRGLPAMQAFYDNIKSQLGPGSRYSVKLHPDTTDFHGDIVIGHGTSDEHVVLGSGKELSYQAKWTAVLKKSGDRWLASRLHISLDPINNPIVATRYAVTGWLMLGAGALGGSVVGYLLGKRRRRFHPGK